MLAFASLTAALLAASPPSPGALVFLQVESATEKEAAPLLEESLRHAFSGRMKIITCKEAIQDETSLKKVLEGRDIKSSADAPKKVGLLTSFSRYDCEIPDQGDLWAAWLTAYVDSRSGRREVSLRMRNLRDPESTPTFASLAEPQDARLSWSELVERCVRRYFAEEQPSEIQIVPSARVRERDPVGLVAHVALSRGQQPKDVVVRWSLFQCSERSACDQFRAAVDEYVACRRANRARSASDPALISQCVDPQLTYDRVGVTPLDGPRGPPPYMHWEGDLVRTLTLDIPGEYIVLASARHAEAEEEIAGAQRITVEPPLNAVVVMGGLAYKPTDAFGVIGYERVLTQSPVGPIGVGLQWGLRLGAAQNPPPPFGIRGLVSPSLVVRHHFTAELAGEAWFAPIGLLYEFVPMVGYSVHPGSMLGVAAVWHPRWAPILDIRAGLMGVTKSTSLATAELYGPLLGASFEL